MNIDDDIKVHWLLDKGGSLDDLTSLEEALHKENCEIHCLELGDYYRDDFGPWPDSACVMFHGSLRMGSKISRVKPWVPGPIYDKRTMRCSHYYPLLGNNLLNSQYFLCPMSDVDRMWNSYAAFFSRDEFFIRPDSGGKSFTGGVFTQEKWWESLSSNLHESEDDALVVIAESQNVDDEYRFFIIDNKVVTGTQYRIRFQHNESSEYPESAQKFVEQIIDNGFKPDVAYVMDVGCVGNIFDIADYRVIEINSFSCSGMYLCDRTAIVQAANELARKLYRDYNNI